MKRIDWRRGWKTGWHTVWELGRVIFPVTLLVSVIQHTPLIGVLISGLSPVMGWIGLPGEAAIPLVLGNLLNLYAAIGAILTLDLTVKQVFILAVMLSFSHSLLVETAICKRLGLSVVLVAGVRLALAAGSGWVIHALWQGGMGPARYGLVSGGEARPEGWGEILWTAVQTAGVGIIQLAAVILPLMLGIQILRDLRWLDAFADRMKPLMQPLGIAPRGAVTMASGLLFGLTFGAGVILEQAKEQRFTRRETTLIVLFLAACHAVVEDTLIFLPLGVNVLPLVLIRLGVAVLMTIFIAWIWPATGSEGATVRGDSA